MIYALPAWWPFERTVVAPADALYLPVARFVGALHFIYKYVSPPDTQAKPPHFEPASGALRILRFRRAPCQVQYFPKVSKPQSSSYFSLLMTSADSIRLSDSEEEEAKEARPATPEK